MAGHQRPGGRQPPAGHQRAGARDRPAAPARRQQLQLTGRGALVAMFTLFFLVLLISGWLGWAWLAGLGFVAGSGAAARYTNRRDLLAVAVSPPLLFMCALVLTRVLTAGGHLLVSVAEGSLLTLAAVAPWLFAGVAVNLIIGLLRGLATCVRDLRQDLRAARAGFAERAPAQRAQSRRATPQ